MPLPVAHGLLGASLVAAVRRRPAAGRGARPLLYGALLANAADLDFIWAFALGSREWHRGFTHSVGFSLIITLGLLVALGRRRGVAALAYGLAYASHAVLDYLTTKEGRGLELLWPLSSARLMLGRWGLSEVPSRLPPAEVLKALAVELALFAPLLASVVWLRRAAARRLQHVPRGGGEGGRAVR